MSLDNLTAFSGNQTQPPGYAPLEFLDRLPALAIILIIVLVVAAVAGTMGNILILVSVATTRDLQNVESVFVVNLACSDLYVTLIADPLSIVGKTVGWQFFASVPGLCRAIGSLCTISCVSSLTTLTAMSCNRYVLIVHPHHYRVIFTLRKSILMCCSFYILGFTLVSMNFFGVGDHSFDHKSLECIWDRMANHHYTIVFSIVLVWVPIVVTGLAYSMLYVHVKRARKKVHNQGNKGHSAMGATSSMAGREDSSMAVKMMARDGHGSTRSLMEMKSIPSEDKDTGFFSEGPVPDQNDAESTTAEPKAQQTSTLLSPDDKTRAENHSSATAAYGHATRGAHSKGHLSVSSPNTLAVHSHTKNGHSSSNGYLTVTPTLTRMNGKQAGAGHANADSPRVGRAGVEPPWGLNLSASKARELSLSVTSNVGQVSAQSQDNPARGHRLRSHTFRLARTLFFIYLVFAVCWLPFSLLMMLDANDTFAHELHVVIVAWAHLHPSINWLVYYHTHSKFRKAFRKLLHLDR